ncbi:MAG: LysR family transcriptional regulator, partial [Peptococcaceae bacterium]|nr:LysR family transcriptional regulator [Peptococcaceae bacterium]
MIRLETLKYLEVIHEEQSLGKAAKRLFLSKSALSIAIKVLEKDLKVSLLKRYASGVELTPAGEIVL